MNAKNSNQNSSTYVSRYGSFEQLSEAEFFLNSACVLSTNQIISIGKSYILIESINGNHIDVSDVQLTEVLYFEELVAIYVDDEMSQKMFLVDLEDDFKNWYTKWMLVDIDFFIDEIREKEVKAYCRKDKFLQDEFTDYNQFSDINSDLVEFDF